MFIFVSGSVLGLSALALTYSLIDALFDLVVGCWLFGYIPTWLDLGTLSRLCISLFPQQLLAFRRYAIGNGRYGRGKSKAAMTGDGLLERDNITGCRVSKVNVGNGETGNFDWGSLAGIRGRGPVG